MNKTLLYSIFLLFLITKPLIASTVKVEKNKDGYTILKDGEPYYIKGAAGFSHYDKLKEYGGNSIRVWTTENAQDVLDKAQELGLTVTLGLFVSSERIGFDYNDKSAIAIQLERLKKEVIKYKDHPALLMWGVGNEVELNSTNPKMWNALNDIAKMIHEVDPNHPTTTSLAGAAEKHIKLMRKKAPHIDILSVNAFKDIPYVPQKIRDAGWNGPYLITEWGATGYWETDQTVWGGFLEETSTQKAAVCKERYCNGILKDRTCLGSYIFLWGHKQERSHTYYSLILESGHETETLDVMQYLWKGKWPSNKAPRIFPVKLNGKSGIKSIFLEPNESCEAEIKASDPEQEQLTYYWELFQESSDLRNGGEGEFKPDYIPGILSNLNSDKVSFKAPSESGPYRLFVYVYDNSNHVATANIPFFIK